MFKNIMRLFVGDPNKKVIDQLKPTVDAVADQEAAYEKMSNDELRQVTADLRARVNTIEDDDELEETLMSITPEAYALVREASRRTTGLRHYDVQIMGGTLLNRGEIVEMRTGEGKTLVATLPLFLNALTGRGVHLITVNEYLVRRDGGWMGQIFHFLGLTVGCIGPQRFSALYDADYVNPGAELEDDRLVHWRPCTRKEAYDADITYGTSSEFGFDYLRDNMVREPEKLVQRELNFAVIDEVDNVLIDEARTPLIISGPVDRDTKEYVRFAQFVRNLKRNTADEEDEPNGHYDIDEKSRSITLTDMGTMEIEKRIPEIDTDAGDSLYDPRFYQLTYYVDNAMKAQYMFHNNKEYTVHQGEVMIINESTGRMMAGRRYSDGLHEAIEAKEGVQVKRESVTVATITIQNYFRLYRKLGGMTGTAMTDAEEFQEIYDVEVTPLPTNVQYMVNYSDLGLETHKEEFENSDRIAYHHPGESRASYFKRTDFPDQVYASEELKDKAIIDEVIRVHESGRPVLVGTTSVEHSEKIHAMLRKSGVKHNVLNAKMHQSEALTVAQAGKRGAVTISTNMAGRGTDILLGGNPEGLAAEMVERDLFSRQLLTQLADRLVTDEKKARELAKSHPQLDEALVERMLAVRAEFETAAQEIDKSNILIYLTQYFQTEHDLSQDIARDMVRYVQLKASDKARDYMKGLNHDTILVDEADHLLDLYGRYQKARQEDKFMIEFLAEQVFEQHYNGRAALVRAVLAKEKEEAFEIVKQVPALPTTLIDKIEEIMATATHEREQVWDLGGLHVVGSERHESRRIDNQLRGRAGRQGDPGSSRFFLSLEDDLMKRFGGERLKSFMNRNIPDDLPIESSVLDRIIASSQERIEGYNFDSRKNVLEYDDVMSKQRDSIYIERRQVLLGEEDVNERIEDSFNVIIDELVDNYLDNYTGFITEQIDRAILDFSAEATGDINLRGVLARLRAFLPVHELDRDELEEADEEELKGLLLDLAYKGAEEGNNLYQLLRAMGQLVPLLPGVPHVANTLLARRGNHLALREKLRVDFIKQVRKTFDEFLAEYIEENDRETIWNKAESEIRSAFDHFQVQRINREALRGQQLIFQTTVRQTMQNLLIESLKTLDSEQLGDALHDHIIAKRDQWRQVIGDTEFNEFQRVLILSAIDREWRDYLTAADDLRREIGLEAAGRQRDPKQEYKKRSFEMFSDMKNNIEREIGETYFRRIGEHQSYIRRQAAQEEKFRALHQSSSVTPQKQKARKPSRKSAKIAEKRQQAAVQAKKSPKQKKKKTIRKKKR